jgi:hypothetical protein
MRSLDIEGFFDFGIGGEEEVEQDYGGEEEGEEGIWSGCCQFSWMIVWS